MAFGSRLCLLIALFAATASLRADEQAREGTRFKLPAEFRAKAAEYVAARARVTGFSGAVLVARAGRPVFREGYGQANVDFDQPSTPRTKFRIGSVTKQFTAAAILLLQQRGRLKITDPVSQYLPDWPKPWAEVRIQHLLTHTGGLPRLTTQALRDVSGFTRPAPPSRFGRLSDWYVPGEERQPLDFKPGEKFDYSNVGYLTLGLVIEKVSGRPYADFVREQIFAPLGMTDTGCEEPRQILKQRASGYTRVDASGQAQVEGRLIGADFVDLHFPAAAGAIYSTVDDLLIWDRILASDRLLSASSRETLFTPVLSNYACGWWVQTQFGRKVEWHRGNIAGFVAIIARYPKEDLFVAVLSNVDRTPVKAIASELAAIAFGEPYQLPHFHKEIKLDSATLDAYLGKYHKAGQPDDTFVLARSGNALSVQFPWGDSFEVFPETPERFFARSIEFELTIVKNGKGAVDHLLIRHEGEQFRWERSP
jgi:CubicO group peptidase (beta-lactamase class C family)